MNFDSYVVRKSTPITVGKKEYQEQDQLFEILSDLVNEQFKPWYCSRFYAIGRERVMILASQARADALQDKQKLFSYLLRKEK